MNPMETTKELMYLHFLYQHLCLNSENWDPVLVARFHKTQNLLIFAFSDIGQVMKTTYEQLSSPCKPIKTNKEAH